MITYRVKMKFLTVLVGLLVAGSLLATGCAQKLGEIDQVQPNWVEKKEFEGEWYFKQTVIDNPYSSLYTFVGDQSPLERGTFDIQEDAVYFYRTYEFTQNSNVLGLKNDGDVPFLRWLEGDDAEYTPNAYQARDKKYAEGNPIGGAQGEETVACGGKKVDNGGMHEFCVDATRNSMVYCGHDADVAVADRTSANAVCVIPSKFVYRGAPLAVYPISSHFDITYSYNPSTGEKTNVKKENKSDRFWYEREFMRADFSSNEVTNYQFTMSSEMNVLVGIYEGDTANEEDGIRFFRDETGGTKYWDYVSRYIVEAPTEYYEYWGTDIPSCVFYPWYLGGILECMSEEIKTRTAFMKVEEDDYLPRYYGDHEMDKFGYFRKERLNYDELYDVTYSGIIRYIQRFDIWANHVFKDDGSEDYAQMDPKPVVYYLSVDFPREYVEDSQRVVSQWSEALNNTVSVLKGADAVPKSGMVVLCENNNAAAQAAIDAGYPVAETDPELCMDMDYAKLNGDIRYSLFFGVNHALQSSPLGYGPSSADPLTGKVISASAYLYLGSLRLYANFAADMVEAAVGFTDYLTLVEGADNAMDDYVTQLSVNENPPPSSIEEAQSRVAGMVKPNVRARLVTQGFERSDMNWAGMRMDMIRADEELEKSLVFDAFRFLFRDPGAMYNTPMTDSLLDKMSLRKWANYRGLQDKREFLVHDGVNAIDREGFADPAIMGVVRSWKLRYDQYVCDAVAQAMEGGEELAFNLDNFNIVKDACTAAQEGSRRDPSSNPSLPTWEEYDPSTPNAGDSCQRLQQGTIDGYYWVNTCTVAKLGAQISKKLNYTEQGDQLGYWKPSPWYADTKDELVGKTQEFVRQLGEDLREEVIADLSHKLFFGLAIHEMGHNFGLRHNFEASTDAMNYPKEYWSLRGQEADGGYVVSDLWGAETDYQVKNSIREYQYSSVMDYGAKFNDLWLGLGHYDAAAIKYGYGGIVEVFKDAPDLTQWSKYLVNPEEQGYPELLDPVGGEAAPMETLFKRVHYSQIPNVIGSVDKIYERKDVLLKDIMGATCESDDDCTSGSCVLELGEKHCMSDTDVQVPYRFCGDEYVYRTPYCAVWDAGADPYEIVRNASDDYWWYWPFWGRWRGKVTFSHEKYADRVMSIFFSMKQQFQWWAVNYQRFNHNNFWEEEFGIPWEQDINGGLAGSMASYEAFSTLTRVFAIPSGDYTYVRRYGYNSKHNRYETWTAYNDNDLQNLFILEEDYGKFAARPMYPTYYLTGDEMFPIAGGAIYDRLNAFMALCDPTTDFLNIEETPDVRNYTISFFNVFPDQMLNLLGGLTTHEEQNYAACVVEAENGDPLYLKLRGPLEVGDPNFCSDGHFLEPEEVDYDFPTTWFRIPMLAAYYGMSLMINNYDRRYMDTTRVFLKGHEDAIDLPADVPRVELADPLSGKIYVAYKMGENDEFDTAWTLVNRGREFYDSLETEEELRAAYTEGGEMHKIIGLLELVRGLHKVYDYTTFGPVAVSPD